MFVRAEVRKNNGRNEVWLNNCYIGSVPDEELTDVELIKEGKKPSMKTARKLKEAGFTVDEIVRLRQENIV